MSFDIVDHWTEAIVYHSEDCSDLYSAVIQAVLQGAKLRGAKLLGADLQGANLQGADLQGANLQDADLQGANLQGAYLQGAYLRGAKLQGAYLRGADLRGANLQGADLQGANLQGAKLQGAKLQGALGLLKDGVVPLQIGGSRHWVIVRSPGYITIGCNHETVEWWEEYYVEAGLREGYTDAQLLEYRKHIAYCRDWMSANGVLEVTLPEVEA